MKGNSRERVLGIFEGHGVWPPPWIPLVSRTYFRGIREYNQKYPFMKWWFLDEPNIPDELLSEELQFRVAFYRSIGADFMLWGGDCFRVLWDKVVKRRSNTDTSLFIEYKTPVGELWQEFEYRPQSNSCYRKNHLVKSQSDLKIYRYIVEDMRYEPNYELATLYLNIAGNEGVFFAHGIAAPMHDFLNKVLGAERTYFALADDRDEIEDIINIQHGKNLELAKIMAQSPYRIFLHQCIWDMGVISPSFYQNYYLSYLKQYNCILHESGKICMDHTSAQNIGPYIELLEQSDFDGITGFAYPEKLCSISLPALARRWTDRMVCIGGLDPHFLATGTALQVKEQTREILDIMNGYSNFILSTADDMVYTTPVENLVAVAEALYS